MVTKSKSSTGKKFDKSILNSKQFNANLKKLKESVDKCEGGNCMIKINEMYGEIQSANDRIDNDYSKGEITRDAWLDKKQKTRKLQQNLNKTLDESTSAIHKCMLKDEDDDSDEDMEDNDE